MLKIALIGYGKMGKTIEKIALEKGHKVSLKIDINASDSLVDLSPATADVAIEFTRPEAAFQNIATSLRQGVPVVCGTTGWLDRMDEIKGICTEANSGFFYASNYSIGVNLFFALNRYLATKMNNFPEYDIEMQEIHHTQKLDAPSGTAITLAEGILENVERKNSWINKMKGNTNEIGIESLRIADTPGTHSIQYASEIDAIEIKHTAFSRQGFASGALTAAEWLVGKKGCFGMEDLLGF